VRVRLLKSWTNAQGRKYGIGWVISTTEGKKMIEKGIAEEYNGEYPPKRKMRTNFFKPK
jgi:hypothetical protein